MPSEQPIKVSSHVSRDFLQNAAYFNTVPKIVWEYVSNSLDAAVEGTPIVIAVEITSDWITISDNGRGMSRSELNNFFQMHGENIYRKQGKRVRGRFGTGKSAAFGLANILRIDTTHNSLRNVVELHRKDIERAKDGQPFPVRDIIVNEGTDQVSGTQVEIRDFNIRRLDVDGVIAYVEKHLSRYRQRALVTVNGHECKFQEPLSVKTERRHAPQDIAQHVGNVELIIKVSAVPLDEDSRGIDILSHGIWHETTLAGLEGREKVNYIFGEVEIPILEEGDWPIPAFDNTRNNILNRQNPIVVVLLGWISEEVEQVRQAIVEKERERRRSEEAKELAKEAERISRILNEDFAQLEMQLEMVRRVTTRKGTRPVGSSLSPEGELWPGGGNEPTNWERTGQPHGSGTRGQNQIGDGDIRRPGPGLRPGSETGTRRESSQSGEVQSRAVFSIEFENATPESSRSRYDPSKTIYINLDHPQVANAYKAGGSKIDSRQFREICYEIAMVEYAIALQFEKIQQNDVYDALDALYNVHETINRLSKRFAQVLAM